MIQNVLQGCWWKIDRFLYLFVKIPICSQMFALSVELTDIVLQKKEYTVWWRCDFSSKDIEFLFRLFSNLYIKFLCFNLLSYLFYRNSIFVIHVQINSIFATAVNRKRYWFCLPSPCLLFQTSETVKEQTFFFINSTPQSATQQI